MLLLIIFNRIGLGLIYAIIRIIKKIAKGSKKSKKWKNNSFNIIKKITNQNKFTKSSNE